MTVAREGVKEEANISSWLLVTLALQAGVRSGAGADLLEGVSCATTKNKIASGFSVDWLTDLIQLLLWT